MDLGDGLGSFHIKGESGKRMKGWTALLSDKILFDFLSWLSSVMPRMQGGSNILVPYLIDIKKKVI